MRIGDRILIEIPIIQGPLRTRSDTMWGPAVNDFMNAVVALRHGSPRMRPWPLRSISTVFYVLFGIGVIVPEKPGFVGASRHANPTANADLLIDQDGSIFPFEGRTRRTDMLAGRILTI